MTKILPELNLFLPFRQHAPSLANARHEIYMDIAFPGEDGAGFFNFAAYSLVLPLRSQIDTDGSTHLPIGKSFVQRESKWPRSIATRKKNTMSSEIAMDKLK